MNFESQETGLQEQVMLLWHNNQNQPNKTQNN